MLGVPFRLCNTRAGRAQRTGQASYLHHLGYAQGLPVAHPPLQIGELARRLLSHEACDSSASAASAAAVETACRRLKGELTDLLGSGGLAALMGRALHLAKLDSPLLAEVTVQTDASSCFSGLPKALARATDEEAAAASAAVLAHLLGLLALLLGEELAMQPVRKLWPHVVSNVREIDP